MTEREMEDLLWNHPDKLLNERFTQFKRQPSSHVGRADLIFKDRLDRLVVVELKRGKLGRGAIEQLHDYFGMVKKEFPDEPVELMVVANSIPEERRLACEKVDIEWREISEKKFRDVAEEVGYIFDSEKSSLAGNEQERIVPTFSSPAKAKHGGSGTRETTWYFWVNPDGKRYFLAFVNAKGSCSIRPFDAETGAAFKKPKNPKGDYREVYKSYVQSGIHLPVNPNVNLDRDCKSRLPSPILAELKRQIPRKSS